MVRDTLTEVDILIAFGAIHIGVYLPNFISLFGFE